MTCKRCGADCVGRYCRHCERQTRREADTAQESDASDPITYECTACGEIYTDEGYAGCPDCGSKRRRVAEAIAA